MRQSESLRAKAMNKTEECDAVVVSFGAGSYQPLLERRFKAVIRKRVPRTLNPRWIYIHVNAPISAICARAEVLRIEHLRLEQVIELARDLDMSVADIKAYVDSAIGCYFLGQIEFPRTRLTVKELTERMVYHPPQSFFVLSGEAKKVIDEMANFTMVST
jgi:predicted transcriptional regulator